jgi:hypothetical protein
MNDLLCADPSGVFYYVTGGRQPDVVDGRCDQSLPALGR